MTTKNRRIVVIDVETTGLSPQKGSRIVEVGMIGLDNGDIRQEFHSLINPHVRIPFSVQKIHGITNEMIENAPGPEAVFPEIRRFIGSAVVVAHHAAFDLGFIRAEMARLGLGFDPPHQCTLQLSRRLFPELSNHRLATVARHVLGAIPDALQLHRALDDARLVAQVWLEMKIVERREKQAGQNHDNWKA